jgi:hypothetical protein
MTIATDLSRRARAVLACGLALAAPDRARAAITWDWSLTGTDTAANGTFTTSDTADSSGFYTITGITGFRNGVAITGLEPANTAIPGDNPNNVVDDLVSAGGTQLTLNGFGFSMADGSYSNPYYDVNGTPPDYFEVYSTPVSGSPSDYGIVELPVAFTAVQATTGTGSVGTSVPEPGTPGLVLAGLAGLLAASAWRRSSSSGGAPSRS